MVILLAAGLSPAGCLRDQPEGMPWPTEAEQISVRSTLDGSGQPAMFYAPPEAVGPEATTRPLVCVLHGWSSSYRNSADGVRSLLEAQRLGWVFVHPDFRGPNRRPEACLSELARQDILDAVDEASRRAAVDPSRVYLLGHSAGGMAALAMASQRPELWRAVFVSCPLSDLAQWYAQSAALGTRYTADMEAVCGGRPGSAPSVDREFRRRSPIHELAGAAGVRLHLSHGIDDGSPDVGPVPFDHSLRAFNVLAEANGFSELQLTADWIASALRDRAVPAELEPYSDPRYFRTIHFGRAAGPAEVVLFEGAHELLVQTAFAWLEDQD